MSGSYQRLMTIKALAEMVERGKDIRKSPSIKNGEVSITEVMEKVKERKERS